MPVGKVFAALARKRPWASLRSQGETGWGVLAEAARGNAAMGLPRGVAYLVTTGASGGGEVRRLVAVGFAGRRGARVDAARRAVTLPMRCPGRFVHRSLPAAVHGGPGVCYDIVSGVGLRRSLRHCFDCLDGKLAHATALAFGLGAERIAGEKAR